MASNQVPLEGLDYPLDINVSEDPGLRKSGRESRPTEMTMQYRRELAKRAEAGFARVCDSFKSELLNTRDGIKNECSEDELYHFQQALEEECKKVIAYEDVRSHMAFIQNFATFQRKADSATACTRDMITHLSYRITEIGAKDFDLTDELEQLRRLKKPYAASIYSAVSRTSAVSRQSRRSSQSGKDIQLQAAEAAAELAASQVRVECLTEQEKKRNRLAELQAHQLQQNLKVNQEIESQRRKLQLLEAQQELRENGARCTILNSVAGSDSGDLSRS